MVMVLGKVNKWEKPLGVPVEDQVGAKSEMFTIPAPPIFKNIIIPADDILIGSLRDARLRVHSPIRVKFIKENEQFIAEAIDFNEFGFGNSRSEALRDLQLAIVELYFTLEKEQSRLGFYLQKVWENLRKRIHKYDHQKSPV